MKMKHHLTRTCLCFLTVGSVMNSSLPPTKAMTDQPQQQSEDVQTLTPGALVERIFRADIHMFGKSIYPRAITCA